MQYFPTKDAAKLFGPGEKMINIQQRFNVAKLTWQYWRLLDVQKQSSNIAFLQIYVCI